MPYKKRIKSDNIVEILSTKRLKRTNYESGCSLSESSYLFQRKLPHTLRYVRTYVNIRRQCYSMFLTKNQVLHEKTRKLLNVFKVLAGTGWGVYPKHLGRLYISIIRSRLDFSSLLYDNSDDINLIKWNIQLSIKLCLQRLHVQLIYLAGKARSQPLSISYNPTVNVISELNFYINLKYWHRKRKIPALVQIYNKFSNINIHSE